MRNQSIYNFELPEEALVGIEDATQKEKAYEYWAGASDWPADVIRAVCDGLVKMAKDDKDAKEAAGEIKTIRFELTIVPARLEWKEAFKWNWNSGTGVLTLHISTTYVGGGWPVALGDGSTTKVAEELVGLF